MSITKGSVPHLIALQIYALISAKASKTKDKLIINISSLCVFSLNFFLSHALLCVFIFILFYSILFFIAVFSYFFELKRVFLRFCIKISCFNRVPCVFLPIFYAIIKFAIMV